MRTAPLPPNAFRTPTSSSSRPRPAPTSPSPTTTLAHLYAHVQAQSNASSSMWRPEARPPLAHARSIHHQAGGGGAGGGGGGLHAELHSQYSMIAVVVLTALFFTITLFATGLLLAFCKKNNTVFSLQKSEQDSNYELDDLDKTNAESRDDDHHAAENASSSSRREHGRSQSFPDLAGSDPPLVSTDSLGTSARQAGTCQPATGGTVRRAPRTGGQNNWADSEARRPSSVQRSLTVAAIHHHTEELPAARTGDCSVRIHVEDVDSKSQASDTAFDHLYLKLHEEDEEEEEEEGEEVKDEDNDDSDVDDVHNDQTRALLKC